MIEELNVDANSPASSHALDNRAGRHCPNGRGQPLEQDLVRHCCFGDSRIGRGHSILRSPLECLRPASQLGCSLALTCITWRWSSVSESPTTPSWRNSDRRRCRCCRPVRGKACGIDPSRHGLRPWPLPARSGRSISCSPLSSPLSGGESVPKLATLALPKTCNSQGYPSYSM